MPPSAAGMLQPYRTGILPCLWTISVHPRTIADANRLPNKGVKATWTDKLKRRYSGPNLPVVLDCLPQVWTPHSVIIDGMFLFNCSPLRTTSTITKYATFLLNRFASPHYLAGAREVHLVFDISSTAVSFNPKCYEHARKDQSHNTDHHQHISFLPSTSIPHNWRTYIECITGYGHAGWLKCVHGNSLSMKMCTLPSPSRTKWVGFQWRWELFCWLGLPKAT